MLKQFISQLQQSIDSYNQQFPPPPPPSSSSMALHHHSRNHTLILPSPRWTPVGTEDTSVDDWCDLVMAVGKSGSMGISSGSSCTTEVMEQEIWKELPEELVEAVIARLPIATFFRFRTVSQKWNSLLTSQSFSQHCARVPQKNPWFYTITHEGVDEGAMYDPSLKKWHHHPIISNLSTRSSLVPVASAGGLVCFRDICHRDFYVCNPLIQSFKELPVRSFKVWSRVAVGMTINGNSSGSGYKILWVGGNGEYGIYDSLINSWSHPGSMPAGMKLFDDKSQTVSIDSTLYFLSSDPEGVISYDMATGVWKQYVIPLPLYLTDHTLAECDGQIMLVGLLTKNAATCVCIWELQRMTLLWKEVDRMPNVWCLDFYGKHVEMTCLGNKGLLMLSLKTKQLLRLVTYNKASKEWQRVHGGMMPNLSKMHWIACGTAFHPCLTAVA